MLALLMMGLVSACSNNNDSNNGGTITGSPNIDISSITLNFGTVIVGITSGALTVVVTNTGSADLTLGKLGTIAAPFKHAGGTCATGKVLAPAANCTLLVSYTPSVTGSVTGSFAIPSDDPDAGTANGQNNVQIILTGVGGVVSGPPNISVSPLSLNFGTVTVGNTSAAQTVIVTNTGSTDLTLETLGSITAPFNYMGGTCSNGQALASATSCTLIVSYSPSASGSVTSSFAIPSDDPDAGTGNGQNNVQVILAGNGIVGTATSTVSGTISAAASSAIDSDVNDTFSPYASNDDFAHAQVLANPVTLGGYVNQPGSGPAGRSFTSGDKSDFFTADLVSGQVVTLSIADTGGGANNLDLRLYDAGQTEVPSSAPSSGTESITVPASASGTYYIEVRTISGASVYSLSISSTIAKAIKSSAGVSSINGANEFVPGEVIVRFKDQPQGVTMDEVSYRTNAVGMQVKAGAGGREMLMQVGTGIARATTFSALGLQQQLNIQQVSDPVQQLKLDTLSVVNALRKRADVISATPNYIYHPTAVPNDTYYNLQWDLAHMNLPQAWEVTTGVSNVIVAVIDTGVLLNHPDLQGQLVAGYDFIRDATNSADGDGIDSNPDDPGDGNGSSSSFHGTHVSGTIAAASDNSRGVAGIAWDAKIMPLRALGINGGTEYDIEQAMRYAAGLANDSGTVPAQKADIINMSLGGPTTTITTPQVFKDVRAAGVIIVAAAGNDASSGYYFPASLDGVVSVSAVDAANELAPYSNYGSTIDITAPGGDMTADINGDGRPDGILSTLGDDSSGTIQFVYGFYQGTSMAAPHVAGAAALMKSVYPAMTPADFDAFIQSGDITTDLGIAGRDDQFGYGVIDAYQAVEAAYSAANGSPPNIPPVAVASPSSLNFSYNLDTLTFTLSNGGGGTVNVSGISNDSGGWLTVTPNPATYTNGLGTFTASVDRTGLTTATNTATITVTTDANTVSIPVIMQLSNAAFSHSAGHLFGLLVKTDNFSDVITIEIGEPSNGEYPFQFANGNAPAPGDYFLVAGNDINNDNYICGTGESCGGYPTLGSLNVITVTGDGATLSGKNFEAGYTGFNPAASGAGIVLPVPAKGFFLNKSQFSR